MFCVSKKRNATCREAGETTSANAGKRETKIAFSRKKWMKETLLIGSWFIPDGSGCEDWFGVWLMTSLTLIAGRTFFRIVVVKKKTIKTELFDLDDFYSIFQSFKFGTLSLGMVKRHLSKMDIFFQRMVKKVGMA